MSGARAAAVALVALALAISPGRAAAEEGLFVARVVGGASTARPDMPEPGGMLAASASLCLSERSGVVAGVERVWRGPSSGLGLGVAALHLPYEGEWTRLYVYAGPALRIAWDADGARSSDLAGQAGLGFEYLFMWGLGVAIELRGTAPAGLGEADAFEGASVALGAGLFTEF